MNFDQLQKKFKPILPKFMCSCGKRYDKQGSLNNHIRLESSQSSHKKTKRGVPEGRKMNLDTISVKKLRNNLKDYIDDDQKLSQEQIQQYFIQIVQLIVTILSSFKLIDEKNERENENQIEIKLQKENIRLQQVWIYIKPEYILEVMGNYFIAFIYQVHGDKNYYNLGDNKLTDSFIQYLKNSHLYNKATSKQITSEKSLETNKPKQNYNQISEINNLLTQNGDLNQEIYQQQQNNNFQFQYDNIVKQNFNQSLDIYLQKQDDNQFNFFNQLNNIQNQNQFIQLNNQPLQFQKNILQGVQIQPFIKTYC